MANQANWVRINQARTALGEIELPVVLGEEAADMGVFGLSLEERGIQQRLIQLQHLFTLAQNILTQMVFDADARGERCE